MPDTATPQPWEVVRSFARELERPETFLRTERANSLGSYDTHSWGDAARKHIAAALRAALADSVPEINT